MTVIEIKPHRVERFVTGRPRHDDLCNAAARYVRAQQEEGTAALVTLARFKCYSGFGAFITTVVAS